MNEAYLAIIKVFPCRGEPIFRGLDVCGGRKLRKDTLTHTGQLP